MDNSISDLQSVFDESALLQRIMDDTSLEKNIISVFLVEIPELILKLKQYINDQDAVNARLQAHTIRGASANLSANNLFLAARRVEELCEAGDFNGCLACIPALEAEFNLFVDVIKTSGLLTTLEENGE